MMSDKKHCSALPQGVVLRKISKDKVPRKFINEKQQLESGKHNKLQFILSQCALNVSVISRKPEVHPIISF